MLYTEFKRNHRDIDLDEILEKNEIIKIKHGNKILLKDLRTDTVTEGGRKYPRVRPFLITDKDLIYIVCPFCFEIHRHGSCEGHKLAHCNPQVLDKSKIEGYIIKK